MLLETNWALCPCGPSPWPFLNKKGSKIFLSDVEWMGVLLHSTDDAALPTEIYPEFSHQNSFSVVFKFHQLETVAAFLHLQCLTLSIKSAAVNARAVKAFSEPSETKLKKKKKKRSPVSPPTVKNFPTCEAPEQSESFCLCPMVVPAERILPSASLQTLNQHLLDWSAADKLTG